MELPFCTNGMYLSLRDWYKYRQRRASKTSSTNKQQHGKICTDNLHKFWWIGNGCAIDACTRAHTTKPGTITSRTLAHKTESINQSITYLFTFSPRLLFRFSWKWRCDCVFLRLRSFAWQQNLHQACENMTYISVQLVSIRNGWGETNTFVDVDTTALKCFVWVLKIWSKFLFNKLNAIKKIRMYTTGRAIDVRCTMLNLVCALLYSYWRECCFLFHRFGFVIPIEINLHKYLMFMQPKVISVGISFIIIGYSDRIRNSSVWLPFVCALCIHSTSLLFNYHSMF